jgi:putative tryptophan/tyrosine transport system substrate-binding protein
VRRREFINLLGAVATLYPSCSRAEQPQKTYVIGFLALAEIPYRAKAWKDGMRKLGYIEGHNLRVEYRSLREGVSADALALTDAKVGLLFLPSERLHWQKSTG